MSLIENTWQVPGLTELAELGAGAQGRVVLARREDGTVVAVKYLTSLGHGRDVFRAEAELLGRVVDPHVAQLYAYIEEGGAAAIVMEAVDGVSLRRILDEHGALEPEAALVILKGAVLGLGAAHRVGVVHRDFKPANVVVQESGDSKLIDFGVAVLTGQGDRSGTPAYMAPEQWKGEPASAATDIYAATCVFFECVAGSKPFTGTDAVTLRAQHTTQPPPVEGIPEPLRPLVSRGLAKNPGERLWDAAEFVAELESTACAAYGQGWEQRGLRALASTTAALAVALPAALAAVGSKTGLLAKLGSGKILGAGAATATAAVVVTALIVWPSDPSIRSAWSITETRPASEIEAVDGGFALYTHDNRGKFEVVAIDAAKGAIRWRRPATPSWTVRGVGMYLAAKGRTVVFMGPVGEPKDLRADVQGVDAVTGERLWTYGSSGLQILARPRFCHNDTRICLSEGTAAGARTRILDPKDGRLVETSPVIDGRTLSDFDENGSGILSTSSDDKDLLLVGKAGNIVWRRSVKDVFKATVSPDYGWWIDFKDGRFVGILGRTDGYDKRTETSYLDRSTLAAFDAATGRPLWTDQGADITCGSLVFTLDHPVRCRVKGTKTRKEEPRDLDVTLEGFDPATGTTRWSWHAGDVPGFVSSDGKGVLRVGDTEYVVRSPSGMFLIDLDNGVKPLESDPPTGWCKGNTELPGVPGTAGPDGGNTYSSRSFWPCDINQTRVKLPRIAPDFAGVRSGDTFAWVEEDRVRAVRIK